MKNLDQAYNALCRNDIPQAISLYQQILQQDPGNDSALHFLALVADLNGDYNTALICCSQAIKAYPCSASYHTTLANVYRRMGDLDSALQSAKMACQLKPDDATTISNAAMIVTDQRRFDKAKELYETALDIEPNNTFIHFNYALLLLKLGDYENGWKEYEWRIPLHYNEPIPSYPDFKGKKVRIIHEQGYGDFIMFARYFPLIDQICMSAPSPLFSLFPSHYCKDHDISIRTMSLPLIFKDIPNKPYVKAPGKLKIKGEGFKIGVATTAVKPFNNEAKAICQDGNIQILPHPANLAYLSAFKRSLPQGFFSEVKQKLFCLQMDVIHSGMVNMTKHISDFGNVADLVDQMDLIITIDTALAHLAGAMGKKTWLLLPYDGEWRWGVDQSISIWYPSVRIFRQPNRGDWESVRKEVMSALGDLS